MSRTPRQPDSYDVQDADGNGHAAEEGTAYPALRQEVRDIPVHDVLRKLWHARRTLLATLGVFLLAGLVFVLGSRREFASHATLMPEETQGISLGASMGLVQQFGGLLGMDGGNFLGGQEQSIPVELYPDILHSLPIQLALLDEQVHVPALGRSITLYEYLDEHQPFSLWEAPAEFVVRLPGRIKRMFTDDEVSVVLPDSSVISLTLEQLYTIEELQERLNASLDKKTGVLYVSAEMPDRYVAAQTVEAGVERLTTFITDYRVDKLRADVSFIEKRFAEAKARFDRAQRELASFRDRNQNLARAVARTEEQRLQAEYDIAFSVYQALANRLEQSRIKVQEETPVFKVLEPAAVPLEKSHPQTLLVLLLALLLGLACGTAYVLGRSNVARLRATLRDPA